MNPPDSSQPSRYQAPEFLSGVVERITYHAEQSGYTVARLQSPRARELVTVIGNFANIQAGQTLELQGSWKSHPQQQFQIQNVAKNTKKLKVSTGKDFAIKNSN